MPSPTIECSRCKAVVRKKKFCSECGQELIEKSWSDEVLDPLLFVTAAKGMKESFENLTLVKFQFISMPNDGTFPQIKPILVDYQAAVYLAVSDGSPLTRLRPDRYSKFEDLFRGVGGAGQIRNLDGDNLSMFIRVPNRPVVATVQLPDWQLLHAGLLVDENCKLIGEVEVRATLLRKTLEQLNLLSADRLFGGAQVQFELQVTDPDKLLETLGDSMIETGLRAKRKERTELHNNPVYEKVAVAKAAAKTWVGRRWKDIKGLFVTEEQQTKTRVKSSRSVTIDFAYTFAHFYERIHLEFRMAVKQAVQNFNAMDLLANPNEGRKAVIRVIDEVMSHTLAGYGIKLNECKTFEFICPELMTLQREKGETKIAEERLKEQGERMKLNRQAANMARTEDRADALLDFEDEQIAIKQTGLLNELGDANTAATLVRQIDRAKLLKEHNRNEALKDGRQEIALGKEKALTENEITSAKRDRELAEYETYLKITGSHESRSSEQDHKELLEFMEKAAKLPEDLRKIALAAYQTKLAKSRPELAAMLVAAQQTSGLEQQLAREREHAKELSAAHTQGTQQAADLLKVLVQQAASVMVANAKSAVPQPPRQIPTAGSEPTEGGAQ